ncbi:MAG: aminopeptidase [Clostridiaceae bacterium]
MSEKEGFSLEKEYKYAWDKYSNEETQKLFEFCNEYREFISKCKTERECVTYFVAEAEKAGYTSLKELIKQNKQLKAGDKVYFEYKEKAVALYQIGKNGFEKGLNIIGAHIDAPRIDLKQNPLYEDNGLALFETHYYGGIKKYQWVALPMALHGVVVKKDGTKVYISIGEDENDPVLGISDLLAHLSNDQMSKTLAKGIEGEDLNVLVGSIPVKDEKKKSRVKENILRILNEKYEISEEDFVSAELEIVPAGKARDYGLDKSMIMGYGQDDRVCSYTAFKAMIEATDCEKTTVTLLVDKEEIGSVGATGMQSRFFENSLVEVMNLYGDYSELKLRRTLANSKMLSADVTVAFDPNYPSVVEKRNSAYFGKGIVFSKYTGARGKSGCNDANPEFIAELRKIFEEDNISWQTSELGKVDQGGGGTIAYILAEYGMEVIDCGVALQNMHAPYEVASKADIFETYKGYKTFFIKAE